MDRWRAQALNKSSVYYIWEHHIMPCSQGIDEIGGCGEAITPFELNLSTPKTRFLFIYVENSLFV